MEISKCTKESFSIIGKEGSTQDGKDFIQNLWADANSNFAEVEPSAKKDENGNLIGIWGAMSDLSRSFNPWENNFTKGLYLAAVEVIEYLKENKINLVGAVQDYNCPKDGQGYLFFPIGRI